MKLNLLKSSTKNSLFIKTFIIYIPEAFDIALLNNGPVSWIYVYNKVYKVILPCNSLYSKISFGFTSSIIRLDTLLSNSYYPTYVSTYNTILNTFYKPSFRKIKFRGKGYYIYKNARNTIAPQFGYSHRLYVFSYFNKVKFIGKTIVIIFGLVKEDILNSSLTLKSKRSINIFTGRGVRFSRQLVYKKQGKVSSYR
jgi:hypothetical protein